MLEALSVLAEDVLGDMGLPCKLRVNMDGGFLPNLDGVIAGCAWSRQAPWDGLQQLKHCKEFVLLSRAQRQ
jgi:hypothetical protein